MYICVNDHDLVDFALRFFTQLAYCQDEVAEHAPASTAL